MKRIKQTFTVSILGLIAAFSSSIYASGYKVEFQSPSVLADSGEAAVVEDAGTNWYNAAGLVYLPHQVVGALTDLIASTRFSGMASAPSPVPGFGYTNLDAKASSNTNVLLPAFHYVYPFKDRYAFGLSIVPAWGLLNDYGENSDVRYSLNKITTKTIDISPSIAMKINDAWSLGLGPDLHYFSLQLRSHAFTEPLTASDSISRSNANNWGRGWHAGVLYRVNDTTRIGLGYRSKIVMNLTGGSDFALYDIAQYHTDQFKLSIPMPPVTTLSIYHDMTPRWALMGTIAYDQWSVIQYYYIQNSQIPATASNPTGRVNFVLPQNFVDAINLGIGTHYKWNDKWMLRGALQFEETPTRDADRSLSFPDPKKYIIHLGARYQVNKKVAIDMMYTHVFTNEVQINDLNPASGSLAVGHANADYNVLGAQVVWDI